MILRLHRRVAAAVLAAFLLLAPTLAFGAAREADTPKDVRERIVRVVKKIWNALNPTTLDGEGIIPPKP